jgi:hypothetical protein
MLIWSLESLVVNCRYALGHLWFSVWLSTPRQHTDLPDKVDWYQDWSPWNSLACGVGTGHWQKKIAKYWTCWIELGLTNRLDVPEKTVG